MTVQRLKDIRKCINLNILFLPETKNPDDFVLRKLASLGFCNHHLVHPSDQGGGGLALFWKVGFELEVLSSCKNFIDARVQYESFSMLRLFMRTQIMSKGETCEKNC